VLVDPESGATGLPGRVGGTLTDDVLVSAGGGPLVVSETGSTVIFVGSADRLGARVSEVKVPPAPKAPGSTNSAPVDVARTGSAWTVTPNLLELKPCGPVPGELPPPDGPLPVESPSELATSAIVAGCDGDTTSSKLAVLELTLPGASWTVVPVPS